MSVIEYPAPCLMCDGLEGLLTAVFCIPCMRGNDSQLIPTASPLILSKQSVLPIYAADESH